MARSDSVPRSMDEPGRFTDVNVRGTLNVLLAARDTGAVVVSASSSSVYGDQDDVPPPREDWSRCRAHHTRLASWPARCTARPCSGPTACQPSRFDTSTSTAQGRTLLSEYAAVVPRFTVACLSGTQPGDPRRRRAVARLHLRRRRGPGKRSRRRMRPTTPTASRYNVGGGGEPTSVNRLLQLVAGVLRRQTGTGARATAPGRRANDPGRRHTRAWALWLRPGSRDRGGPPPHGRVVPGDGMRIAAISTGHVGLLRRGPGESWPRHLLHGPRCGQGRAAPAG